jgi:hypothetical protein
MRYLLLFLSGLVLTACNSSTKTSSETSDTLVQSNTSNNKNDDSKPATPEDENEDKAGDKANGSCYMQVLKRDTMVLHINSAIGDGISGKLSFDNYEKDGSTGTVKGKREGDVVKLIYSFQSEGMNSVMEVYFKEENESLVRGVGEMQTKGDTAYFVQPDKITYPSNGMMKKTDCKDVPAKYK